MSGAGRLHSLRLRAGAGGSSCSDPKSGSGSTAVGGKVKDLVVSWLFGVMGVMWKVQSYLPWVEVGGGYVNVQSRYYVN